MEFTKAHGTGNDFVVLEDLDGQLELSVALVRALCDRRTGVGADGVIRLGSAEEAGGGDVFMDYRNADGSVVEMCGNGVRVVAKHVVDHGLVEPRDGIVEVATRAGLRRTEIHRADDGRVAGATVDMGSPTFAADEVPFDAPDPDQLVHTIDVDGDEVTLTAVSMGNPHAVIVVDDVAGAPVRTLGPRLETDPRFPKHTNVEFVQTVSPGSVRLRVWERGVGETASCGTGICAAAVALARRGLAERDLEVTVPGGTLQVRWDDTVWLTGPAVEVARGRLNGEWLAALDVEVR